MTSLEDRLRDTLQEMADEAVAVPMLQRLEDDPGRPDTARRLVAVVAAAAAAAVLAATSYLVLRSDEPSFLEPVERPPKVFRLSGETVTVPGRAQIAVFTPHLVEGQGTIHVHAATGGPDVTLATSDWVPSVFSQELSQDGTRIVRQHNYSGDPRLEVVNLASGAASKLGGYRGFCPRLSPDNRIVATFGFDAGGLVFIDGRTGRLLPTSPREVDPAAECPGIGWSPDGRLLVVGGRKESLVLDAGGRTVDRIPDRSAVNGSMSWSPDGESILMYHWKAGKNVIRDVADGSDRVLEPPAEAVRPQGWAGSRVVWLVGQPGDQRLVTTDQAGADPRPWMRMEIGDVPVESVQWSRELSGRSTEAAD